MCAWYEEEERSSSSPPLPFPEKGLPRKVVLGNLRKRLAENIQIEKGFGSYTFGPSHPFGTRVYHMAMQSTHVPWAQTIFPGTCSMAYEAVRMVGSLFGATDPVGFITSGGTESNLIAMRLARNLSGKKHPEIVMPESAHFSFKLAAELFGMKVRNIPLSQDRSPQMEEIESLINENTAGLVCSAPEGELGSLDPVGEFSEIALRKNLYLHVDAAIGGFILPFMRELGYHVPPFDFHLPGVTSVTADAHKMGMVPLTASFFVLRDKTLLNAVPTEEVLIHTITSTKSGGSAAAAWALFKYLGREGYVKYAQKALDVTRMLADGVGQIEGLRLVTKPFMTIIALTSDVYDLGKIQKEMKKRGYMLRIARLTVPSVSYFRIPISPLRKKSWTRAFLKALTESVRAVRLSQSH